MHVLITGAGGHLGRKLFDVLEADPDYKVSGIDIRPVDHPDIPDMFGPFENGAYPLHFHLN